MDPKLAELTHSMGLTFDSLVCAHRYTKLEPRCVICQTFSLGIMMASDTSIVPLKVKLDNATQQTTKAPSKKRKHASIEPGDKDAPKSRIHTPIPWWFTDALLFGLLCRRSDSGPPETEKDWYAEKTIDTLTQIFRRQGL